MRITSLPLEKAAFNLFFSLYKTRGPSLVSHLAINGFIRSPERVKLSYNFLIEVNGKEHGIISGTTSTLQGNCMKIFEAC
jgi:hypothetical protein